MHIKIAAVGKCPTEQVWLFSSRTCMVYSVLADVGAATNFWGWFVNIFLERFCIEVTRNTQNTLVNTGGDKKTTKKEKSITQISSQRRKIQIVYRESHKGVHFVF